VSAGFLTVEPDGRFGSTPLSETLITDGPGSMRWFTVSELGEEHYAAWGDLLHSVKTGEIAFDHFYGMGVWDFFQKNPDNARTFNDSMTSMTAVVNEAVMAAYSFSGLKKVVDVGGGHGGLITSILKANPDTRGVLFDAEQVISGARSRIEAAGVAERCELEAGDFFEAVAPGGDCYLMKWIIHDWDDERSIRILKNCRSQMTPNCRLVVIDTVVPEHNGPDFSKFFELNMLVMTGRKERTATEFRSLFERSGFTLTRITPTESPVSVIEGTPA
jgi:hypothetical protein